MVDAIFSNSLSHVDPIIIDHIFAEGFCLAVCELQKDEFTEKVVLQPFKSSILNQDESR